MMSIHLIRAFIISAFSLFVVSACSTDQKAQSATSIELSYASPYSPNHPFSVADKEWMEFVTTQSQGELTFKPFWSGSLISSDMNMLEIRHGIADVGFISPIYSKGGTHLIRTSAGFYGGVKTIEDQVAVYDCLAAEFEQYAVELHGLKVLAVQGGNFPAVITRDKPIQSLEDFKGMRLRVQSEAVEVLRNLGADPINMPMGEVYSALAKGVIDGVIAAADTIHSLHFSEVAKHFTSIHFSRSAYPARAMSEKAWLRLSPKLQGIVMQGRKVWEAAIARELRKSEQKGIDFGKSQGLNFNSFPADEQRKFDELFNQVALEQSNSIKDIGIEAEPVFLAAQRIIANGSPIQCEQSAK